MIVFHFQDGALSAGINMNKTTIMLMSQDLKSLTGRIGKAENDIKKGSKSGEENLQSLKAVVLELDDTVSDLVGSMGTIMEDGDALNLSIEKLQAQLGTTNNSIVETPVLARRHSDLNGNERGAQRVKDTIDGFAKTVTANRELTAQLYICMALCDKRCVFEIHIM